MWCESPAKGSPGDFNKVVLHLLNRRPESNEKIRLTFRFMTYHTCYTYISLYVSIFICSSCVHRNMRDGYLGFKGKRKALIF